MGKMGWAEGGDLHTGLLDVVAFQGIQESGTVVVNVNRQCRHSEDGGIAPRVITLSSADRRVQQDG